jgi:predicted alpha/beta superfamily hydrolase
MKPVFTLHCDENKTDYWIYVHCELPALASLPAVLFMDGDDQFAPAVAAYTKLRSTNAVRPLLLVGVGYGASYTKPANRRGRDYTPVAHSDEPTSGGAGVFLKFLTATLWPELERRYSVDANMRAIAGHSLGSLLVLYALFQPRPFFTHYLASAPSVWWADRDILRHVERFRARQATLPAELFLGVGEHDTESMTQDFSSLEKQLAARPFAQLQIYFKIFPERDHYSVLPDAFGFGLNTLFGVKPPAAAQVASPASS